MPLTKQTRLTTAMAATKHKPNSVSHTSSNIQPKKVIIMRPNQKVARVSLYCKLNMLVPQLRSMAARAQSENSEKGRKAYSGK
ncbi:hypothetical protein CLV24_10548 [Pontibacter ummariensis]|uniref:Uncharacterized protein n=1 Tax=Pontibacter ummariensis TaxID=1610492 RepID=A0A239E093_9BACT|nr:hypothetical protein CLV24_10548 [Pontibacter ummariensis]SNS37698.1 hypothetical protein SAMN06296052_105203 [Pontibacter ummariensis]